MNVNFCSVLFGLMEEKFKLIQLIIAVTTVQIWKTRTKVSIKQTFINSNTVFKQMCTELKRSKSMDSHNLAWDTLNLSY